MLTRRPPLKAISPSSSRHFFHRLYLQFLFFRASDLFLMCLDFFRLPGKVSAEARNITSCAGARCSACTSIETKAAMWSWNSECAESIAFTPALNHFESICLDD